VEKGRVLGSYIAWKRDVFWVLISRGKATCFGFLYRVEKGRVLGSYIAWKRDVFSAFHKRSCFQIQGCVQDESFQLYRQA